MSRESRIILSNCPHHIIQRGHNRQVVFATDNDYLYYLNNLKKWKQELGCKVFSYCLMTNHVHLIVDPGERTENIGLLMKRIAGRQTRYINKLEQRSGSLWEGRYKSSPISGEKYLLACCRYIELNPLRAGIIENPSAYRWSSCPTKTGKARQPWLDFDEFYLALGQTDKERAREYKLWLEESIPDREWELIREAAQRGQLTGDKKFEQQIFKQTGRRIKLRGPGRPKAEKK